MVKIAFQAFKVKGLKIKIFIKLIFYLLITK